MANVIREQQQGSGTHDGGGDSGSGGGSGDNCVGDEQQHQHLEIIDPAILFSTPSKLPSNGNGTRIRYTRDALMNLRNSQQSRKRPNAFEDSATKMFYWSRETMMDDSSSTIQTTSSSSSSSFATQQNSTIRRSGPNATSLMRNMDRGCGGGGGMINPNIDGNAGSSGVGGSSSSSSTTYLLPQFNVKRRVIDTKSLRKSESESSTGGTQLLPLSTSASTPQGVRRSVFATQIGGNNVGGGGGNSSGSLSERDRRIGSGRIPTRSDGSPWEYNRSSQHDNNKDSNESEYTFRPSGGLLGLRDREHQQQQQQQHPHHHPPSHHHHQQQQNQRVTQTSMDRYDRRSYNNRDYDIRDKDRLQQSQRGGGGGGNSSSGRYLSSSSSSSGQQLQQHNNSNNNRRMYNDNRNNEEPEWFSSGPTSQHDTIELRGFDEPEPDDTITTMKSHKSIKHSSESSQLKSRRRNYNDNNDDDDDDDDDNDHRDENDDDDDGGNNEDRNNDNDDNNINDEHNDNDSDDVHDTNNNDNLSSSSFAMDENNKINDSTKKIIDNDDADDDVDDADENCAGKGSKKSVGNAAAAAVGVSNDDFNFEDFLKMDAISDLLAVTDDGASMGTTVNSSAAGESRFRRWFNNTDNSPDKTRLSSLQENLINLISSPNVVIPRESGNNVVCNVASVAGGDDNCSIGSGGDKYFAPISPAANTSSSSLLEFLQRGKFSSKQPQQQQQLPPQHPHHPQQQQSQGSGGGQIHSVEELEARMRTTTIDNGQLSNRNNQHQQDLLAFKKLLAQMSGDVGGGTSSSNSGMIHHHPIQQHHQQQQQGQHAAIGLMQMLNKNYQQSPPQQKQQNVAAAAAAPPPPLPSNDDLKKIFLQQQHLQQQQQQQQNQQNQQRQAVALHLQQQQQHLHHHQRQQPPPPSTTVQPPPVSSQYEILQRPDAQSLIRGIKNGDISQKSLLQHFSHPGASPRQREIIVAIVNWLNSGSHEGIAINGGGAGTSRVPSPNIAVVCPSSNGVSVSVPAVSHGGVGATSQNLSLPPVVQQQTPSATAATHQPSIGSAQTQTQTSTNVGDQQFQSILYHHQQQQQQQQQHLHHHHPATASVNAPQNQLRVSPLPNAFVSPVMANSPITLHIPGTAGGVPQRIPSPRELQFHTQSIMQSALIKKKLEEQRENYRKRQEMQQSISTATTQNDQQQTSTNTITTTQTQTTISTNTTAAAAAAAATTISMTPQQSNSVVSVSPIKHNQIMMPSSPTPLAFTPTSVLRKRTAEKDMMDLLSKLSQHQNQLPTNIQQQQQQQQQNQQLRSNQLKWNQFNQIAHPKPMEPIFAGRPIVKGGMPIQFASNIEYQQMQQQYQQQQRKPPTPQQQSSLSSQQQIVNIIPPSICGQQQQSQSIVSNQTLPPQPPPTHTNNLNQQQLAHLLQHRQQQQQQQQQQKLAQLRLYGAQYSQHAQQTMQQIPPPPQQQQQATPPPPPPQQSPSVGAVGGVNVQTITDGGGMINYNRDGGLSPTSNQLARWFSPELLAQASAGKLPSLSIGQALSLEEFERSIQQSSSTTVHN